MTRNLHYTGKCLRIYFIFTVPTAPRNFYVELMNEENPQVQMTWQKPQRVPGELKHYKVSWGRKEELMYSKVLSAIHYSFVTDKLGGYHSRAVVVVIVW